MYLISFFDRFRYYCKRNNYKHITITCTVRGCPWKITCRAMGASNVVKMHTFINDHSHTVNDVVTSQPFVRSNRASMVIDEVIRSTPEYQLQEIFKDFIRDHSMRLTYYQLWKMKEKPRIEYMVSTRIIISCCLGCVSEFSEVLRAQLWS